MKLTTELKDFISKAITLHNFCLPQVYPKPTEESLENFQDGYKINSVTGQNLTGNNFGDFKENWYVICRAYAADPFFIDDTEKEKGFPVYFSWASSGKWEPLWVANSLTEFTTYLQLLKRFEHDNANMQDTIKQHFDINDEFWGEVYDEYEDFNEQE